MSYVVVVYEGNYPEEGGVCKLLGVYRTKEAAKFIADTHKRKNRADPYPRIFESNVKPDMPESKILEENLKLMEIKANTEKKVNINKQFSNKSL